MNDNKYFYKKIDIDMKLYEMMHEKVMTNDKRAEAQCVQIYVSIAAILGFVGLVYRYDNVALDMVSIFMVIYILPFMAFAAIESVISIVMRDTYAEIFMVDIEKRINGYLQKISNDENKVLGYEEFQFLKGFRKDNTSNLDMYFLGTVTLMIGIGIPSFWVFFSRLGIVWKTFFALEIVILIIILIHGLINLYRRTIDLRESALGQLGLFKTKMI